MRVRRELRSLSEEESAHFFASLKVLRRTRDSRGVEVYGERFRSYGYLTIKHALAAFHAECDQGHLERNQIVFHRALMLEFENALLAVVEREFPNSTLKGLPYWDWMRDARVHGTFLESSLWKYWGSPFGDPDDRYCAHDPFFETKVPRLQELDPWLKKVVEERFGAAAAAGFGNGFGFLRSPWSPGDCPGLSRNPGWVLDRPALLSDVFKSQDDCLSNADFATFAACMQGRGYLRTHASFGPHNAPHVFMGTYYDDRYGAPLALSATIFSTVGLSAMACTLALSCLHCVGAESLAQESPRKKRHATRFLILQALVISTCIVAFSVWVGALAGKSGLGAANAFRHSMLSREWLDSAPVDFTGAEWRTGLIDCPAPYSCSNSHECMCTRKSILSLLPTKQLIGRSQFAGSDFWDGAFSINENFFFPMHGVVDLLHLGWAKRLNASASVDFGGVPAERLNGCPGTAIHDVVSEEMCFTRKDLGMKEVSSDSGHIDSEMPRARSPAHAAGEACLSAYEIFAFTMGGQAPYEYDIHAEAYTWQAIEPAKGVAACPPVEQLCSGKMLTSGVKIFGSMACRSSIDRQVVDGSFCEQARPKPPAPFYLCNCTYEMLRKKAGAISNETQSFEMLFRREIASGDFGLRTLWSLSFALLVFAFPFLAMALRIHYSKRGYTPIVQQSSADE